MGRPLIWVVVLMMETETVDLDEGMFRSGGDIAAMINEVIYGLGLDVWLWFAREDLMANLDVSK